MEPFLLLARVMVSICKRASIEVYSHHLVCHQPLTVANRFVDGEASVCKTDGGMDVVGHDDTADNIMPLRFQVIKPFVNGTVRLGDLEQVQPARTCKGDEINRCRCSPVSAALRS